MDSATVSHYLSEVNRVGLPAVTRVCQESRFPRHGHRDEVDPRSRQKAGLCLRQVPDQHGYMSRHCSCHVGQMGAIVKGAA